MFTGIIKEIGTVKSVTKKDDGIYFVIEADTSKLLRGGCGGDEGRNGAGFEVGSPTLPNGASISVNGACQTVIDFELSDDGRRGSFTIQSIPETMRVTNFGEFEIGSKVNLEPAMKLSDSIDGHLVQGHIDCIGEVLDIVDVRQSDSDQLGATLGIKFPESIEEFIVYKGSITINGVSLTVSKVGSTRGVVNGDAPMGYDFFEVSLISHTFENTNLGLLKKGDKVNLEVDMMARYAAKIIEFSKRKDS